MIFDLPAEGRRLMQRAEGYRATVVSGVVTFENGEATGELPGKLVRGPQSAPAACSRRSKACPRQSPSDRICMMTDVTPHLFASEGAILRGQLYTPPATGPWPVVVMAHGFSAVAAQLEPQARAFAEAGFAAFVFDNPGFGLSGGFPRQEVDPVRQVRGYRDAVSYVRTLAGSTRTGSRSGAPASPAAMCCRPAPWTPASRW